MMKYHEIIVVVTTNIGNIYRSIFVLEKVSKLKFIASIVLNTVVACILILFTQEHHLPDWQIVLASLGFGIFNQSLANILIRVATNSEDVVVNQTTSMLKNKIKKIFNEDSANDANT